MNESHQLVRCGCQYKMKPRFMNCFNELFNFKNKKMSKNVKGVHKTHRNIISETNQYISNFITPSVTEHITSPHHTQKKL